MGWGVRGDIMLKAHRGDLECQGSGSGTLGSEPFDSCHASNSQANYSQGALSRRLTGPTGDFGIPGLRSIFCLRVADCGPFFLYRNPALLARPRACRGYRSSRPHAPPIRSPWLPVLP